MTPTRRSARLAALLLALLAIAGCPPGATSTRLVPLSGYSLNTAIRSTAISNRTYDFYLGNGVTDAVATFAITGDMGGASIKLLDGQGSTLHDFTAPTESTTVTVPGNFVRAVLNKPTEVRPLVSIRSFGAQQTTAGGLPQAVTSIQTGSLGSFPLALNQPVFLPMPPDEARITYVTVPGIRGKSLELFVDGPAKVFASDEEHGFILDIGTAASVGSGSAGVFTTLAADNDHDQLLLTIESPSTPDPSTLILSVNDNVTVHNLKIRFLGRASDFSRTDEELITTLDDILERASRMIYSVTQGHARLGEAEVVIGRFAQPGFHETMSISPVALPGAPEAFVTLPRVIHANREWWQLPVEDAALVLTHEFFHSAYLLPDEYHDGFPDLINGPHRTAQSTCGSSIMGVRELLELCVAATHGSTPRPTQQHTSMWELLAPQLTNVPVPVHSTTEFARGLSTMKLPVNTH